MLTLKSRERLPGEYDGAGKFHLHSSGRLLKRLGAIERAYEDFQKGKIKRTGVMIHYVIQEVDRGEPIITQEVEIKSDDRLEDLQVNVSYRCWSCSYHKYTYSYFDYRSGYMLLSISSLSKVSKSPLESGSLYNKQ